MKYSGITPEVISSILSRDTGLPSSGLSTSNGGLQSTHLPLDEGENQERTAPNSSTNNNVSGESSSDKMKNFKADTSLSSTESIDDNSKADNIVMR